jgi:predicted nucleotidyltransferase
MLAITSHGRCIGDHVPLFQELVDATSRLLTRTRALGRHRRHFRSSTYAWETERTQEPSSTSPRAGDHAGRPTLQLAAAHRAELAAILGAAGVDFARHRPVVFGSRAEGTARRYSDIDLGLAGEPLSFDQLGRLSEALEESELPYRVDVVNLAETSREFRALALARAVPLKDTPTG